MTQANWNYRGKTVLIIGATAGIGRATALAFAAAGANLLLVGRRQQLGEALAQEINHRGGNARFFTGDASREADAREAVQAALEHFGQLDIAINNAGVIEPDFKPLDERSSEEFDALFAINVRGVFLNLKYQMAAMRRAGRGGVIVNVSSVAGVRGAAGIGLYMASKHAVEGLSKSAALDGAADGIRVLTLQPHATESEMISRFAGDGDTPMRNALRASVPLGRFGKPEEQANALLFMCSEDAGFMTGSAVAVDGGFLAR